MKKKYAYVTDVGTDKKWIIWWERIKHTAY